MDFNNRNDNEFWFDNRYGPRGQNRENYHHQDNFQNRGTQPYNPGTWHAEEDNRWQEQPRFDDFNDNQHRYQTNRNTGEMNSQNYGSRNDWQQDSNSYGSGYGNSRYGQQEGDYNSGWSGNRDNFNQNDNDRYGAEFDRGGRNWGHSSSEQGGMSSGYTGGDRTTDGYQNSNSGGGLGAAAVGGSFTSYSASRSRSGAMGHNRSGGMLHRDGPGMNSYRRGDINANSNW